MAAVPLLERCLLSLLALLLSACVTVSQAQVRMPAPLQLDADTTSVQAWPAITLLSDPGRNLTLEEALAQRERFAPPVSAYATLGMGRDVVWLRLPLHFGEGAEREWILDIDYTLLNRVEVYVFAGDRLVQKAVLGNAEPFAARPLGSRSHALPLRLPPEGDVELLMRVDTAGARILPITLNRIAPFHARSVNEQMLQGMMACLGLGLLLYSLLQWFSLRESLYLKYALLVFFSMLFSVHFFGIGEMYLWTDLMWPERHLAGVTSLMAASATALFVEDALDSDMGKTLRRAIRLVAAVLAGAALAHALDWIDIQMVGNFMSTLGLAPALMGLPGAVAKARRGEAVGIYFILAWLGYFVASAIMVGVVRGRFDVSFLSMHSFQFGATLDMLIFMRIAVLRSAAKHHEARQAASERDTLHSLAHSDPLTGLLNRRGLNEALAEALPRSSAGSMVALYVLDLDEFKPVNDQFGHDVGDELLLVVAQRLRASVRQGDAVARFGGDEFVVMAGGLSSEAQAHDLGQKLLAAFAAPFALRQQTCRMGATIGYGLAPFDGVEAGALLKAADASMYAGKQGGRNRITRASSSWVGAPAEVSAD
jgi:diguanylate cyclase (GGDEF)-like protein